MGHLEVVARTGDVIVLKGIHEDNVEEFFNIPKDILKRFGGLGTRIETASFTGEIFADRIVKSDVVESENTESEYDLPGFIVDIYNIKHVILVTGEKLKMIPLAHIDNEVFGLYRNWAFDSYDGERMIGKTLLNVFMNKDDANGFVSTIISVSKNNAVAFLFEVLRFLDIKVPNKTSEIEMNFQMSSLLDLGAGFHTVNYES